MAAPRDHGIIPLSRYRAQLSRARAHRRADEILDHPDPARLVPTLSVQDLYYAIREVGLESAYALVALATPSQVRGFIDLDAWERDHFVPEKAAPWLDALIDLGPDRLLRVLLGLDAEVVALWLQRQARVYDLEQEAPPDEPEGHFYPTPDTFFLLDVLPDGEPGKRVERFIDWLYRADLEFARRAVMAARWELPSDLEEHAFRWRSGRMADLGYVDYYEALEIYRYLDPASVRADEQSAEAAAAIGEEGALPVELLVQVGEGGMLGRALAQVSDAGELRRLSGALMHLMNRVMSADRVDAADVEGAHATMRRAAAWIGLGLELLGRGDAPAAAAVLARVAVSRIFRVGLSLTLKLRRVADVLVDTAWVSLVPGEATLLDAPYADLVRAVRRARPMFPSALSDDPAWGSAVERPFATLAEIALAARTLEEAAQIGEAIRHGLGVEPRLLSSEALAELRTHREAITFATLVSTIAANIVLDRPPALVPIALADLPPLVDHALEEDRLRPAARLRVARTFTERFAEREYDAPAAWDRWLDRWLAHFEESLRVGEHHPEAANLLLRR